MSAITGRSVRQDLPTTVLMLAVGLFLTGSAGAQAPRSGDLLDEYSNRTAVAAQQLENDVRDAIADARRLAQTDPGRAVQRLKKALSWVDMMTVRSAASLGTRSRPASSRFVSGSSRIQTDGS